GDLHPCDRFRGDRALVPPSWRVPHPSSCGGGALARAECAARPPFSLPLLWSDTCVTWTVSSCISGCPATALPLSRLPSRSPTRLPRQVVSWDFAIIASAAVLLLRSHHRRRPVLCRLHAR